MPDQYQSSGAAFVPPLGRRSSPTCQSAELVDVDALMGPATLVSGAEPLDAQRATVLAEKSISYAKLYQFPAWSWVDHWVLLLTHQRRELSEVPASPERRPYLISVKWLCRMISDDLRRQFFTSDLPRRKRSDARSSGWVGSSTPSSARSGSRGGPFRCSSRFGE